MNQTGFTAPDFSYAIGQSWTLFMGVIQQFWPYIVSVLGIVTAISLIRVIIDRVSK